jgi:hypothetical protein
MANRMTTEARVEVGRVAYQLQVDHGHNAHVYAAKLALKARQEGDAEMAQFWQAVSDALKPRGK